MSDPTDYAAYLSEEGRSFTAAFHEFRLAYTEGGDEIHVFLEGDDDVLFYLPDVRTRAGTREIHVYKCGGKPGVLSAKELVEKHGYDLEKCAFFVDRDFDDFLGRQITPDSHIYVTDTYSIENILVSMESIKIVLTEFVGIPVNHAAYKRILSNFVAGHARFARLIRPFMAWILALRSGGYKPNLNNADLSNVFEIAPPGSVQKKPKGFEDFRRAVCNEAINLPCASIKYWIRQIRICDEKKWIRGKYEIWFLRKFIDSELKECARINLVVRQKKIKIPPAIREARFFDILGARVPKPASLMEFLDLRLAPRAS